MNRVNAAAPAVHLRIFEVLNFFVCPTAELSLGNLVSQDQFGVPLHSIERIDPM
ncbi:hypothetical protein SAMN05444159_2676 [Bradyrhizobium lablabi]|jgi:hypothetical protein|uniref:Uncharacterized protein n=1 Tax=Bradyrhizobium lablabi TaxID=722472 RepID=A0A1M6QHD2_9BRAD|nr:hypothetical protein SAMN05444159_2676 [Bradyrhizobium lablabi]